MKSSFLLSIHFPLGVWEPITLPYKHATSTIYGISNTAIFQNGTEPSNEHREEAILCHPVWYLIYTWFRWTMSSHNTHFYSAVESCTSAPSGRSWAGTSSSFTTDAKLKILSNMQINILKYISFIFNNRMWSSIMKHLKSVNTLSWVIYIGQTGISLSAFGKNMDGKYEWTPNLEVFIIWNALWMVHNNRHYSLMMGNWDLHSWIEGMYLLPASKLPLEVYIINKKIYI